MVKLNPKVSIVIPVYNGANFLAEAIDSALTQTYQNTEVIVVDDGSTDNGATDSVALSYGDRIKYYHKKNGGVASALNYGIEKMTGEFFSWLSHDDLYGQTKIEEQIKYLSDQPVPGETIVACNSLALFDNEIKKREKIERYVFDHYFDIFLGASAKVGLNGCSLLIPRKALIESGGFNTDLPVTQDYDLWFRLKDKCKFILLERYLVVYRHHDRQDSVRLSEQSLIAGDELRTRILKSVSKKYFDKFLETNKKNEKWIWENYRVYKSRGFTKTALAILHILAEFYDGKKSKKISKIMNEVVIYERIFDGPKNDIRARDRSAAKRIDDLIYFFSNQTDVNYIPRENLNKMGSYIESIKDDGLYFFIQKALRKLVRIFRKLI